MKKYKLVEHNGSKAPKALKQIRALRDIPEAGVKKGDLGGFLGGEHNLSQLGSCWVYDSARVYDSACVSGSAHVSGLAHVYDSARVYYSACVTGSARVYYSAHVSGLAHVYDSARVYDSACVTGSAHVFGLARVSGSACVYDSAHVYGSAHVSGSAHVFGLARVSGSARVSSGYITKTEQVAFCGGATKWPITVTPWWVRIGCEIHTRDEWDKNIETLCKKHSEKIEDVRKWLKIADSMIACLEG